MDRRHSALAVAALIGLTGFGVSHAASAGTTEPPDTTESAETTEAPDTTESADSTEADSTEADSTESVDASEPADTGESVDTTDATETTASLPAWEPEPVDWSEGLMPGTEEGWLEVPIDYANPDDGTFRLYVTRHLATGDRIGSLLVNPGGPGFGGSDLAISAEGNFSADILDHFDIVGFDPRGTGFSEPAIDCVDDYDQYYAGYDITPDDETERQELVDVAEEFTTACVDRNADILQFVGTNNAARDMDSIRRALGEAQISYFGLSYGSELGGVWATLFPGTVRAAVLSGASDPNVDPVEHSLQQVVGFEETLSTYLAQCSADPGCAFHNDGDAEGGFDELMLKLDAKPIPSVPGRPDIDRGVARRAVAESMYSDTYWPSLSEALAAARDGDGAGLLALYDSYFRYDGVDWGNEFEAFQVISCMDDSERLTVEEEDALVPLFNEAAPRMAPSTAGGYFCTFFPESSDPRVEVTGAGAGPIVVCGTTGDSATPLQSTRNMAAALDDGRLIVVEADQHTCHLASQCADEIIDEYLVDLVVPAEETDCPA